MIEALTICKLLKERSAEPFREPFGVLNESKELPKLSQIHYTVAYTRFALKYPRLDQGGFVPVVEILNRNWVLNFYKVSRKRGIS